jgi:hypothetical protein
MNLNYQIDFHFCDTTMDAVNYIFDVAAKLVDHKYKQEGDFYYKTNQHTEKASYYGPFFIQISQAIISFSG